MATSGRQKPLGIIVAVCESNLGIGVGGQLPWRLRKDMAMFRKVTSRLQGKIEVGGRRNAVLMGRKTWQSIPSKFKPLSKRLNIVLTRHETPESVLFDDPSLLEQHRDEALTFSSLQRALDYLDNDESVEQIFAIGGNSIYDAVVHSGRLNRIYWTSVKTDFPECDAFFPISRQQLVEKLSMHQVFDDEALPIGLIEENNVSYECLLYEK